MMKELNGRNCLHCDAPLTGSANRQYCFGHAKRERGAKGCPNNQARFAEYNPKKNPPTFDELLTLKPDRCKKCGSQNIYHAIDERFQNDQFGLYFSCYICGLVHYPHPPELTKGGKEEARVIGRKNGEH